MSASTSQLLAWALKRILELFRPLPKELDQIQTYRLVADRRGTARLRYKEDEEEDMD